MSVEIEDAASTRHPMRRTAPEGFFEVAIPNIQAIPTYFLLIVESDGSETRLRDPYAFPPVLSSYDLHLIGEGQHYQSYEKMGAHPLEVNNVKGVPSLCCVGSQCPARQRHRRFQPMGWASPSDAKA